VPALRAQLRRAELDRDVERERLVAAALARALVKRRSELDIAVRLGRRAVLLGDESLRMDLATWHCQLGQTALAVGMLTPLLESPGLDRARLALRIASYFARLGDAEQALAALREAAAHDPEDPLVYELMAMVHGWAPWATSAEMAANAYLQGAAERLRRKETSAAFQDSLRAFDTAPAHPEAAAALAQAFEARGQTNPADEVWRRHAHALAEAGQLDQSAALQRRRVQTWLDAGRWEEALAATFDAGLDIGVDAGLALEAARGARALGSDAEPDAPPAAECFDWLLCKIGLWEPFAARLELAAEAAAAELRSRCLVELGHIYEKKLDSTERALEPWMSAVLADPRSEAARENLRRYATQTGDYAPLVEALVRVGVEDHRNAPEGSGDCLRELWRLAEDRLGDVALASWCVRRALRHEPRADDLAHADQQLVGPAKDAERELDTALEQLAALTGDERASSLRRVAAALRGFPSRSEPYLAVLWELVERLPDELRLRRLLEMLLARTRDSEGLARLWTRDLVSMREPLLVQRALVGLSRLERQGGNLQGSLAVLAADDGRGSLPAASMQLALAAQLGSRRPRADALLKLGVGLAPGLRAWLASVASAELLGLGEAAAALAAAEVGTHADPSATRPVVAFANAARGRHDRVAAVAYERAMALTFPSSAHCRALVDVLDVLGESYAAQVWTARWLSLRPAETEASIQLLRRSAKTGDAARLGDVIAWTVSRAHPLAEWSEPLAHALTCLADSDRARAAEVAWRILDAFGPESPALRQAVLVVAEQSDDIELEVAVFERELAADGNGRHDESLWRLAEKHFERGEVDRGHATLVRALAAGVDPRRVLALCESTPETHSPEGEFHRLEARAGALELLGDDPDACWLALREFGAALWDLAGDPAQAVEVWLRAAELGGAHAWFHFARDLVEVLGLERALDEVCRLAETRESSGQVAALLTAAAVVAKSQGGRKRALSLGLLALDTDPSNVWALEIIESSAHVGDMQAVESAYKGALAATLGAYGERALHYRAARYFERAGEHDFALVHAIAAFRAVPSEGVTFALMLRLAHGAKDAERAARAVEEVASEHSSGRLRSQWLRRAAMIAGGSVDGAHQRMEALLRALLAAPDTETVDLLGRAFTDLARREPDGRELGHLRFGRAVERLVPRLESVDGARVALAMASVAVGCFSDAKLALSALTGAVHLEPEIDDFGDFVSESARLAAEPDDAEAWLTTVDVETDQGQRGSLALLELASEVALALGSMGRAAGYLARRIERGPDNEALCIKAEQTVQKSRDLVLPPHVHGLFPVRAQQAQLLGRAERAQDRGTELSALSEAFQLGSDLPAEHLVRLLDLASDAGQLPLAEQALAALQITDAESDTLVAATQRVSALLIEHRRPQRALTLLNEVSVTSPGDVGLMLQALSAARAAGDDDERQNVLGQLIELTPDAVKRSFLYNEAWEVAKKRGQPEQASEILRRWLESDPEDTRALSRLEAECEARQDWSELVALLGRHLALGVTFRERRRLVLRRAELLEGKLGRLAEARQELGVLVEQAPADRTVVERLALVTEQLGDHSAAASAWLTASGLSSTRPAAAQLAERAARLYLDSGEVMAARRVLAAPQTLPRTLGLARLGVRLERDGENEPRLARALEELGGVEDQPARERADAWLEAANLWRRLANEERAGHCAQEAARLVPDDAEAQLLASYLVYRRSGELARDDARKTVERLHRVFGSLAPEQADLAAFLLAESLDVFSPAGAGLNQLLEQREQLGATPLVSVGIAERLARGDNPRAALEHFDVALRGGDLRGLRKPSRLALGAAEAAGRAELFGLVHRYCKLAEIDSELSDNVALLREGLPDTSAPSVPPSRVPPSAPGHAPARRVPEFMSTKARVEEAEPQTRPARRTQIGLGRPELRPGQSEPAGARIVADALASHGTAAARSVRPMAIEAEADVESAPRSIPWGREPHHIEEPVERARFEPRTSAERDLWTKLNAGSAEAGLALCAELGGDGARVEDFGAVSALTVGLRPGSRSALAQLERAARAAGDAAHAMAVAHVLGCAGSDRMPTPPPLEQQREQVDLLRRLLFTEADGQFPEALDVVWQSTHRVLEWENIRGLEVQRIGGDERQPLVRAWSAAARLFGLSATVLLRSRAGGEYRVNVVMLGEPSVLVRGEPPDNAAQVSYDLGAALAGTLPPFAIVNAATYEQIDDLFRAVQSAFGNPEASRTHFTSTARLSALLWESLPPRTQRRMTEWCKEGKLTRDSAVASARRAARRAGLFASGDLGEALRRVAADEGIEAGLLAGPEGLSLLCERSKAAADLVRLAADPVYAHLRWRGALAETSADLTRRGA
jgi:tetratricopeptide (TPR) repeat protein